MCNMSSSIKHNHIVPYNYWDLSLLKLSDYSIFVNHVVYVPLFWMISQDVTNSMPLCRSCLSIVSLLGPRTTSSSSLSMSFSSFGKHRYATAQQNHDESQQCPVARTGGGYTCTPCIMTKNIAASYYHNTNFTETPSFALLHSLECSRKSYLPTRWLIYPGGGSSRLCFCAPPANKNPADATAENRSSAPTSMGK